jgi:hypothetical protein
MGQYELQAFSEQVWLGWAYLTKTMRKPQCRGVGFDPPMVFCACSIQNTPGASEIHQGGFRTNLLFTLSTCFGGPGWL